MPLHISKIAYGVHATVGSLYRSFYRILLNKTTLKTEGYWVNPNQEWVNKLTNIFEIFNYVSRLHTELNRCVLVEFRQNMDKQCLYLTITKIYIFILILNCILKLCGIIHRCRRVCCYLSLSWTYLNNHSNSELLWLKYIHGRLYKREFR